MKVSPTAGPKAQRFNKKQPQMDADFAGTCGINLRRFGFTGAVYQNRLAVKIAGFLLCEHKRSLQLRLSSGRAAGVKPKGKLVVSR